MSEWLKEHAWKACVGETLPWVRIPLSPPDFARLRRASSELRCAQLRLASIQSLEGVARAEAEDGSGDVAARLPEGPVGGFHDVGHGLGAGEVEDVQHH